MKSAEIQLQFAVSSLPHRKPKSDTSLFFIENKSGHSRSIHRVSLIFLLTIFKTIDGKTSELESPPELCLLKLHKYVSISWVIPLRDKQTNKQTNAVKTERKTKGNTPWWR